MIRHFKDQGFLIAIILFDIIMFVNALKLNFWASKIVPITVCILIFTLSLVELFRINFLKHNVLTIEKPVTKESDNDEKNALPITVWVLAYFGGIYFFGFLVATILFVGGYMKQNGSAWKQAIITTAIFSAIFILLFNYILKADLYQGILINIF